MSEVVDLELAFACRRYRNELDSARADIRQLEYSNKTLEQLAKERAEALEKANARIATLAPRVAQLEEGSRIEAKYRAQMTEEIRQLKARKRKAKSR